MALKPNQKKVGTEHRVSKPDVARTGRDSFLKRSGSGHPDHKVSDRPDVKRAGRASGVAQVSPSKGIGRGKSRGSDAGVSRLPDDISSV